MRDRLCEIFTVILKKFCKIPPMHGVDSARPKRSWIITCVEEDGNTEGRGGLVDSSFLVGTCLNNNICISGEKKRP